MLEGKPALSSFETASTFPQGYHWETRLHSFDFFIYWKSKMWGHFYIMLLKIKIKN